MRRLLAVLALALGTAGAHTEITVVTPAAGATVRAPASVSLKFSEPISLRFSTFKVYPLKATAQGAADKEATALAGRVMTNKNDAAARADRAQPRSETVAALQLPLKPGLAPGYYAVLWRVLSDDGHPVGGHSLFRVR